MAEGLKEDTKQGAAKDGARTPAAPYRLYLREEQIPWTIKYQLGRTKSQRITAMVNAVIENAKAAVAGGVKLATVDAIAAEKPGVIVVGGAICNADDPAAMATAMKERMKQ